MTRVGCSATEKKALFYSPFISAINLYNVSSSSSGGTCLYIQQFVYVMHLEDRDSANSHST
jgi:hypothetical protein